MSTFYYECQICGYPIPFDPQFDIDQIDSESYIVDRDGGITTCASVEQCCTHLEDFHPVAVEALNADDLSEVEVHSLFSQFMKLKRTEVSA